MYMAPRSSRKCAWDPRPSPMRCTTPSASKGRRWARASSHSPPRRTRAQADKAHLRLPFKYRPRSTPTAHPPARDSSRILLYRTAYSLGSGARFLYLSKAHDTHTPFCLACALTTSRVTARAYVCFRGRAPARIPLKESPRFHTCGGGARRAHFPLSTSFHRPPQGLSRKVSTARVHSRSTMPSTSQADSTRLERAVLMVVH